MTYQEIQERIKEYESEQKFDQHIVPINYENAIKVDENFDYIGNNFGTRFRQFFQKIFVVNPYSWWKNNVVNRVRVYGRENLKNLDSAIVTCNHTNMFDCLAIKKALRGRKVKITAGDFNNQRGFFGEMMRVGGMMPFGSNREGMKNFNEAFKYFVDKKYFIAFYPEQAMWPDYEKPRPLKNGAFHYAVKYDLPILPIFITYRSSGRIAKNGREIKYMNLHILPPIYSKKEDRLERIHDLITQNSCLWENCYNVSKMGKKC